MKFFLNSEVFTNFVFSELEKEKQLKAKQASIKDDEVLEDFSKIEYDIRNDPKKFAIFKSLQEKFANDPEYTKTVDKKFVDGVMLLDLRKYEE